MIDHVTQAFLSDESLHGVMARLDLPPALHAYYGHRLVPRPFFLDRTTADTVAADIRAFYDLLTSLPDRLFDGSLARFADALGVPPEQVALMSAQRPALHGRADLYRVGDEFRLLELNSGSQLGNRDFGDISRATLEVPLFQGFAREHDLSYVHPVRELLRLTGSGTVAFLEAGGMLRKFEKGFASLQESCARLGVDVLLGELENISERNGHLYLDGTRLDAVVRFFSPRQAVGKADEFLKATKTEVCTPLENYLYGNKATLALLSLHRDRFEPDELALVDRLLPWTRYAADVPLDHLREHRETLILKASDEFAGTGVHAGWLLDDGQWRALLDDTRGAPYVVQERVRPTLDVVPGDERPWLTNWGWFVTEEGFAGLSIRSMPHESGAVVSFAGNPDTRVSGLLLHGNTPS
ncbi:hypothetical protein ABZ816_12350 [Actinosynnema sp. NPDC047251]|uniref:Glutathionylspermidine synthase pre-ATP-grasp-like domain-containing protein n=1 Tax=Saccharothrix espanaensis (strain ATCC 51144 / DSM 44229 / JCM 9112 / NBRC 15066 / NRRL 15764) TaxID=1179773 RepID=K0KFS4_SACES|nr:hypothetical protein [Saccharothrix espanaensis]CCH35388.1 hypothetical protein BN6_81710 [Saccharothrix espanaensis DSM 44229]